MNKINLKIPLFNESEINSRHHKFYFERGNQKENSKELFDAIRQYNKAIELDPKNSESFKLGSYTSTWIPLALILFIMPWIADSLKLSEPSFMVNR